MSQEKIKWIKKQLEELYQLPLLEKFLGLEIIEVQEGKIILSMKIKEEHSNVYGVAHGGTLASICDEAMGIACVTLGKRVVTVDMNVSYIKNAPTGSTLTAIGEVISDGRKIMWSTGKIYHDDQLLVSSQASYFVVGELSENDYNKSK